MASFNRRIFDIGLNGLRSEATSVYLCSAEPTTWAQVFNTPSASGYRIASKSLGAGNVFDAPENYATLGRRMSTVAVSNGIVDYTGTATHYVIADDVNQRILVSHALTTSRTFRTNGSWSMNSVTINFQGWTAL